MTMVPLVSVIIPTRGRPRLLRRAISSALGQSESNLEVIVVVDGQDPDTDAELDTIHDPRLVRVNLDTSVGGSEARNIGVRKARSRWVALLDDDDEWLPSKLSAQTKLAEKSGIHDVVVTSKYIVRRPGAGEVVRPRRLPRPDEPITEYMFDYLCYFQTSTFLCSREFMLKMSFEKDLKSFQDIDWFLRVMSSGEAKLAIVPEALSIYYAPVERSTVTSNLGWHSRLEWGRSNRHRMSRRAYSRFIAGSCAGRAAQDNAGLAGLAILMRECIFAGSPTPSNVALLLATFLVTPKIRHSLRDWLFLSSVRQLRM